jgi:hypothetical protein
VYDPLAIRRHAEGFGRDVFLARMRGLIDREANVPTFERSNV